MNSQLGDGVNQSVVGDIDQELKMVQKEWCPGHLQRGRPTEKVPLSPKLRVCDSSPKVAMLELLTACREWPVRGGGRDKQETGRTLTSVHQKAQATVAVSHKEQATRW